jgi:septal ring factor EnvC (AmiA/AmiB activator)
LLGSYNVYGQNDAVAQFDRDISAKTSTLDSIKIEIEKGRAVLTNLQKDEGNYLERIEQIEKNINASKMYLEILTKRIDSVESVIVILKDSLDIAKKNLIHRKTIMQKRMRIAYKRISVPPLLLLLQSNKNPLEFMSRIRYLQEIHRYDRQLLNDITHTRILIDKRSETLQKEKSSLAAMLTAKKEEQQALLKEEQLRKSMLEDIRTKKKVYSAMIEELEAAQKQLNVIIKQLEEKRKKAKKEAVSKTILSFEKRKGKLSWPVEGPVLSNFGKIVHPVYKTVTMNNGIDIGAVKGQPVHCVAPGTVIHTGWMRGLGQIVIVDHSAGYLTVYAHLQNITVTQDQSVELGTSLGTVGDTGSMGGPRLHFQIRKSTDAFDPSEWLEK